MGMDRPRTVGELRASGYRIESVKDEMRRNLVRKLRAGEPLFPDILGYEETVVPQIQNAILSRHDMLFLGLRGQAKTRMLRQLVHLLDEFMPVVAGSRSTTIPIIRSRNTPGTWWPSRATRRRSPGFGREQRYHEKLATPDVTIADLIGEIDMIKHAEGRYLSSELTMHFGLIPRTNRGIFCINELPDLAPRSRSACSTCSRSATSRSAGYPIRLELDLCMVFSANPEDYTNRGRIVTPLKDRIGSVVRTHYPLTREIGIAISEQNAWLDRDAGDGQARPSLAIPIYVKEIVEEISRLARTSPHVNQQSGVSVRMSIANLENVVSNAERRALVSGEALDRPPGLRPGLRRGQLARQARADDERGRGARGQADPPDHRRGGQEHLRRSTSTSASSARSSISSSPARTWRSATCCRPRPCWNESPRCLACGSGPRRSASALLPDLKDRDARDAATASAAEFILEGLHVHNKLNKAAKTGGSTYRR